jgi:capsular polysaccharide biosynthesis protein
MKTIKAPIGHSPTVAGQASTYLLLVLAVRVHRQSLFSAVNPIHRSKRALSGAPHTPRAWPGPFNHDCVSSLFSCVTVTDGGRGIEIK